jgi:hypothetical protein
MMKSDSRLNHGLQKKFFLRPDIITPAVFPCIMRRMKLTLVVQVYTGEVFDWIGREMLGRVSLTLIIIFLNRVHAINNEINTTG